MESDLMDPTDSHHTLQAEDLAVWMDAVERFVRQALAPHCLQSEHVLPEHTCLQVIQGLQDLGVLNQGPDAACGLWDEDHDPLQRDWTLRCLQAVARHAPGLAYQVHTQALGARLDRMAGVDTNGVTLACLSGQQGLGREAVVAYLAGVPLTAAQQATLSDNWTWPGAQQPRWLHALPGWTHVWVPTWEVGEGWLWHRVSREQVSVQVLPYSHGLHELATQQINLSKRAQLQDARMDGDLADQAWRAAQAMHAVGLQAISQAVLESALARALDFARIRKQGGRAIIGHQAVQHLLSRAVGAVKESSQVLQGLVHGPVPWPDLLNRWRERARCQVSLSAGASAALQVFGGMGYMQDNAMEKALRDVNHLRLLGGSPAELNVCVAYWDTVADTEADTVCGAFA